MNTVLSINTKLAQYTVCGEVIGLLISCCDYVPSGLAYRLIKVNYLMPL